MKPCRGFGGGNSGSGSGPLPSGPTHSVIIPTYNERDNIAVMLWLLHTELLVRRGVNYQAVVVDDGSPDGTQDVVRSLQSCPAFGTDRLKLVTRPRKMGLGSAYRAGLQHASGAWVILMDADLSHHPKYIGSMIERQAATGCDIVTGTRYVGGGGVAGWNLTRKTVSRGANLLASFVLGASTSDLTGSFRLYRRPCLEALLESTSSTGYAFQMEVIVRAQYSGFLVAEVPIVFVDRLYGDSKLGPHELVLFLKGLLRLLVSL